MDKSAAAASAPVQAAKPKIVHVKVAQLLPLDSKFTNPVQPPSKLAAPASDSSFSSKSAAPASESPSSKRAAAASESPSRPAGGGARPVVLVRCQPGPDGQLEVTGSAGQSAAAGEAPRKKYVLTGIPGSGPAGAAGVLPPYVRHGDSITPTKASRARHLLRKRAELDAARQKYLNLMKKVADLEPSPAAAAQTSSAPVVICEPEGTGSSTGGRALFFVGKSPAAQDLEKGSSDDGEASNSPATAPLPDAPQGRATAKPSKKPTTGVERPTDGDSDDGDEFAVLKTLSKYQLSEKFEILPPSSTEASELIIHKLRVHNLGLKTELLRMAMDHERRDATALKKLHAKRGRKKPTTAVSSERLRELEKIEAGMHTVFTPAQIRAISREYKKNAVQWKHEDLRRALCLLEISDVRTFNYLRQEMLMPFPSVGTLKNRCPEFPDLNERLDRVLPAAAAEPRRADQTHRASQQAEPLRQIAGLQQPSSAAKRRKPGTGAASAKKTRVSAQQPVEHLDEFKSARTQGGGKGRRKPAGDQYAHFEVELSSDELISAVDEFRSSGEEDGYASQLTDWTGWDSHRLQ